MATHGQQDGGPTTGPTRPDDRHPAEHSPGELSQITRAIVTIYKEQFGRGPELAHSHYAGANTIICVLEGTLTPIEQTLGRSARGSNSRTCANSSRQRRSATSVRRSSRSPAARSSRS